MGEFDHAGGVGLTGVPQQVRSLDPGWDLMAVGRPACVGGLKPSPQNGFLAISEPTFVRGEAISVQVIETLGVGELGRCGGRGAGRDDLGLG